MVCAVAVRGEGVLASQGRPADAHVAPAADLRATLEGATATGCDWIWLLDGTALPRPDALATLLDGVARSRGLDEPALLTGVTLGRDGDPDEARPLWYRRNQIDLAMVASARRLLPVRAASGSVLVRADAAAGEPPPAAARVDPPGVLEWTARLLRSGTGYLVPESESDAVADVADPATDPRTAARLLLGGALVRLDRLRYGFELAERALSRSDDR